MLESTTPLTPSDEPAPETLVEVGVYTTARDATEHGLVVLATGNPYWLESAEGRHRLLVEPTAATWVRRQLQCFDRESAGWPPRPVALTGAMTRAELGQPLLWALLVLLAFWAQARVPAVAWGALDAQAVFVRHEWWRPVTALFLHADAGHILANGISGVFVLAAVLATLGRARGWLAVAGASILGNVAAVSVHFGGTYRSVGASTLVFAALGLLTGHAVRQMATATGGGRGRAMAAPLAAGVTVLALYGAGGVHVDVLAHLTGFAAGVGIGLLLRPST
ncbi:rhomboid family intramembrane serine protease [Opitutus sp. ER46]|uniref:rhomboid family intramembrane serine protease n=1 Tax=Opitutus sp. ER46 TaxID=2161864 RepID=UPI000D30C5DA|nr:rhomboid family intramembrane serine protease [Opitutus sp. ER46]PTX96606.1 hypothetical protein DB354_08085 [Opitutus sp. ER46]